MARASSASMTTASSGSRSSRKLTTQSSQAVVPRSVQQSQSIVRSPAASSPIGSMSGSADRVGSPWSPVTLETPATLETPVTLENSMTLAVSLEVGMSMTLSVGAKHGEGV